MYKIRSETGTVCRYVDYLANNLNLCLRDVTNGCDLIRTVTDFIYNLVQLIRFSPKRLSLFESLRNEISLQSSDSACMMSLRTLCPTQWTVRHGSIDSIVRNYQVLQTALETIQEELDECAAKASGLLELLCCL